MVDLLFLYSKQTTKVKISNEGLPPDQRDIGEMAKADLSDDEDEIIGLKVEPTEDDDQDLDFTKSGNQDLENILKEINQFRYINDDEDDHQNMSYSDQQ